MREKLIGRLRALVGLVGLGNAAVGVWAIAAPHAWYTSFPAFGRHWLVALGPYDEHLARDAGSGLLAVGVLLLWAALAPAAGLLRPALISSLAFTVPHLGYHVASSDRLPAGDDAVNLALLVASVALPAALLWAARGRGEGSPRGGADPAGGRLARVPTARAGAFVRLAERYSRRRYGTLLAPLVPLEHHPALLRGTAAMEYALQRSHAVDWRLKDLAATRAAQLAGCEFCIDFGAALIAQHEGAPAEEIEQLPRWRDSDSFSALDRLALEYAEALTRTPVEVPDELFEGLRAELGDAGIVELTAAVTFENHRARMNQAFGLGSQGFATAALAGAVK